jgi:hypothetical protein
MIVVLFHGDDTGNVFGVWRAKILGGEKGTCFVIFDVRSFIHSRAMSV